MYEGVRRWMKVNKGRKEGELKVNEGELMCMKVYEGG